MKNNDLNTSTNSLVKKYNCSGISGRKQKWTLTAYIKSSVVIKYGLRCLYHKQSYLTPLLKYINSSIYQNLRYSFIFRLTVTDWHFWWLIILVSFYLDGLTKCVKFVAQCICLNIWQHNIWIWITNVGTVFNLNFCSNNTN